jgi:hypothetical protein
MFGKPRIGKSYAGVSLQQSLLPGDTVDPNPVVPYNLSDRFMSSWKGHKLGLCIDDFVASQLSVDNVMDMLQICSSALYSPNMAALSDKGSILFEPQLVMAMSNSSFGEALPGTPNVNIDAFWLRFIGVQCILLDKFSMPNGQPDKAKIKEANKVELFSHLTFQIWRQTPGRNGNIGSPEMVGPKIPYRVLVGYLYAKLKESRAEVRTLASQTESARALNIPVVDLDVFDRQVRDPVSVRFTMDTGGDYLSGVASYFKPEDFDAIVKLRDPVWHDYTKNPIKGVVASLGVNRNNYGTKRDQVNKVIGRVRAIGQEDCIVAFCLVCWKPMFRDRKELGACPICNANACIVPRVWKSVDSTVGALRKTNRQYKRQLYPDFKTVLSEFMVPKERDTVNRKLGNDRRFEAKSTKQPVQEVKVGTEVKVPPATESKSSSSYADAARGKEREQEPEAMTKTAQLRAHAKRNAYLRRLYEDTAKSAVPDGEDVLAQAMYGEAELEGDHFVQVSSANGANAIVKESYYGPLLKIVIAASVVTASLLAVVGIARWKLNRKCPDCDEVECECEGVDMTWGTDKNKAYREKFEEDRLKLRRRKGKQGRRAKAEFHDDRYQDIVWRRGGDGRMRAETHWTGGDGIEDMVAANTKGIRVLQPDGSIFGTGTGFFVRDGCFVMNSHVVCPSGDVQWNYTLEVDGKVVVMDPSTLTHVFKKDHDVMVLKLDGAAYDLSKYVSLGADPNVVTDSVLITKEGPKEMGKINKQFVNYFSGRYMMQDVWTGKTGKFGDSGSPLLIRHLGLSRPIVGIQSCNITRNNVTFGVFLQLNLDELEISLARLSGHGTPFIPRVNVDRTEEDCMPDNTTPAGFVCFPNPSSTAPTTYATFVEEGKEVLDYREGYGIAKFGDKDARCNLTTVGLLRKHVMKATAKTVIEYDATHLKSAMEVVRDNLISPTGLPPGETLTRVTPLMESEILCGHAVDLPEVGPIDLSTSPGFPDKVYSHTPGKGSLVDVEEEELRPQYRAYNDWIGYWLLKGGPKSVELADRWVVDWILKDEVLPMRKLVAESTRAIGMSPLSMTYYCKRYFGHFVSGMKRGKLYNCCAVGLDINSIDWHNHWARTFSQYPLGFDGDFGDFDSFLNADLMAQVKSIILSWYSASFKENPCNPGLFEQEQKLRAALLDHMLTVKNKIGPQMFTKTVGLNSGHYLTTTINTLVCQLLIYYAWFDRVGGDPRGSMFPTCYGDDHVVAVTTKAASKFNSQVMHDVIVSLGGRYTRADVNKGFGACQGVEGLGFLGTTIRFDDELQLFLAKPDYDSLFKIFAFTRARADPIPVLKQGIASNLIRAFGGGRGYYGDLITTYSKYTDALGLSICWPNFDDIKEWYFNHGDEEADCYPDLPVDIVYTMEAGASDVHADDVTDGGVVAAPSVGVSPPDAAETPISDMLSIVRRANLIRAPVENFNIRSVDFIVSDRMTPINYFSRLFRAWYGDMLVVTQGVADCSGTFFLEPEGFSDVSVVDLHLDTTTSISFVPQSRSPHFCGFLEHKIAFESVYQYCLVPSRTTDDGALYNTGRYLFNYIEQKSQTTQSNVSGVLMRPADNFRFGILYKVPRLQLVGSYFNHGGQDPFDIGSTMVVSVGPGGSAVAATTLDMLTWTVTDVSYGVPYGQGINNDLIYRATSFTVLTNTVSVEFLRQFGFNIGEGQPLNFTGAIENKTMNGDDLWVMPYPGVVEPTTGSEPFDPSSSRWQKIPLPPTTQVNIDNRVYTSATAWSTNASAFNNTTLYQQLELPTDRFLPYGVFSLKCLAAEASSGGQDYWILDKTPGSVQAVAALETKVDFTMDQGVTIHGNVEEVKQEAPRRDVIDVREQDFVALGNRPQLVTTFTWSSGDQLASPKLVLSLPFEALVSATISAAMQRFVFSNFKMRVTFVVNSNVFQAGRLIAYFVPLSNSTDAAATHVGNYPSQMLVQHIFIPAGKLGTYTLEIPWRYPLDALDLRRVGSDPPYGTLIVEPFSLLRNGPTSKDVTVAVNFSLIDGNYKVPDPSPSPLLGVSFQFTGMYAYSTLEFVDYCTTTVFRGWPVGTHIRKFARHKEGNQWYFYSASGYPLLVTAYGFRDCVMWKAVVRTCANKRCNNPVLNEEKACDFHFTGNYTSYNVGNVNDSSIDFKTASSASADAKLDVPNVGANPPPVVRSGYPRVAGGVGVNFAEELQPIAGGQRLPTMLPMGVGDMNLANLAGRYTFLTRFAIDATTPIGTVVFDTLLTPTSQLFNVALGQLIVPSLLAYVALPFTFWRGDLCYKFVPVLSPVHNLRLAFTPNYNRDVIVADQAQAYGQYAQVATFDAEHPTFEVVVPYISNMAKKRVLKGFQSDTNAYSVGTLAARIYNQLQAPETVSQTVDVLVFVCMRNAKFENIGVGPADWRPVFEV